VPHAQHTSRALESVNNDFPSWWSREQRAELTYREISPRDGRKKNRRRKMAARRKNEKAREQREEYTEKRRRPFRRARISSRALDLITKVMRCSTTPLKGI